MSLSRVISQQTFDDAVKENIEEFSMSTDDAIKDAIQQFESQGVSLQNIITNSLLTCEVDILTGKIKNLQKVIQENPSDPELVPILNDIKTECDDGVAKRVLAGQCGLYTELVNFLTTREPIEDSLKLAIFETLIALMTGYPDLLDCDGFKIIQSSLKCANNDQLLALTLKWTVECCIKHEHNRYKFLSCQDVMAALKRILAKDSVSSDVLRTLCKLFQTFVLNDDIRAEIPLAHKHACQISNEFLSQLVSQLRKFREDKKVTVSILQALIAIIVRHEYCQHFVDAEGLELLRDIMIENIDDETVCRSCYSLIKVVAGNDNVKAKMLEIIDASLLISTTQKFLNLAKTCNKALAAFNMLSLRNSHNCQQLRDNNVAEVIVQSMKVHSSNRKILKNVCWLIKNFSQGNEKFSSDVLTLGAEEILREFLVKFEDCSFEINIALRVLGCEVETKEMWTGEGKGITN